MTKQMWYVCEQCKAMGVKLWRPYNSTDVKLLCADCACADQKKDASEVDEQGQRQTEHGKTDQIGWYVPAVPCGGPDMFWGYTSVPDADLLWWENLPTRES